MTAASKLPATIGSRYVPVRLLGRGGMGVVYEVEHARTGDHLALKVLLSSAGASPEALARFKREARAPAQIKSENVVRVTDADVAPELDGAPFLVMELLEGVDLEQAVTQEKPTKKTVVEWLWQIAPALDKAHRLGIIHRDLKPQNLFLATVEDRPSVLKILDFGIAKMAQEGSAATASGQVLGTPQYMAPEQAARQPHVTSATDRHALGLIAYRLLVGESYYRGDVMSILAELLHGVPSAPSARNPNLGEAFDAWFMKACHREPEQRFASASQQIEALAEALGLPLVASGLPPERWRAPSRRGSSRPVTEEAAFATTVLSFGSLFRRPNARWTLPLAALALLWTAATLWRSRPRLTRLAPAAALSQPTAVTHTARSPVPARTVTDLPSGPASPESPTVTVATAAAKGAGPERARMPHALKPRAARVSQPSLAPAPDPFQDQK